MFHKATDLKFNNGTSLEVRFRTGETKRYDVSGLFAKYPQMEALKDRRLFCSGKLTGSYGILWNDELDLDVETVYEDGELVRIEEPAPGILAADAVLAARARTGMTQKELAALTGISQADISRIERGTANPSLGTLKRIADALGMQVSIRLI